MKRKCLTKNFSHEEFKNARQISEKWSHYNFFSHFRQKLHRSCSELNKHFSAFLRFPSDSGRKKTVFLLQLLKSDLSFFRLVPIACNEHFLELRWGCSIPKSSVRFRKPIIHENMRVEQKFGNVIGTVHWVSSSLSTNYSEGVVNSKKD